AGDKAADTCQRSSGAAAGAFYVGATDINDSRASFSNFGRCLTMFAPGAAVPTDSPTGPTTISTTGIAASLVTGTVALFAGKPEFAGKSPADIKAELVTKRSTPDKITGLDGASPNLLLYTGPPGFFTIGDSMAMARHNDGRLELFAVRADRPAHLIHA